MLPNLTNRDKNIPPFQSHPTVPKNLNGVQEFASSACTTNAFFKPDLEPIPTTGGLGQQWWPVSHLIKFRLPFEAIVSRQNGAKTTISTKFVLFGESRTLHRGIPLTIIQIASESIRCDVVGFPCRRVGSYQFNWWSASLGGEWRSEILYSDLFLLIDNSSSAFGYRLAWSKKWRTWLWIDSETFASFRDSLRFQGPSLVYSNIEKSTWENKNKTSNTAALWNKTRLLVEIGFSFKLLGVKLMCTKITLK